MIRYALNCDHGHEFESWFPSSSAYDKQAKRGLLSCPQCGSGKIDKAIMAPRLSGTNRQAPPDRDARAKADIRPTRRPSPCER